MQAYITATAYHIQAFLFQMNNYLHSTSFPLQLSLFFVDGNQSTVVAPPGKQCLQRGTLVPITGRVISRS